MSSQLVVDASVVAKLYLKDEVHTENAALLFSRFASGQIQLAAPRLIKYEVPAAIRNAMAAVRVDQEIWEDAINSFQSLGLAIFDDTGCEHEAIKLAIGYGCSYYDALYLLLAEDLGYPFVTADERVWKNMRKRVQYVVHLGSYK